MNEEIVQVIAPCMESASNSTVETLRWRLQQTFNCFYWWISVYRENSETDKKNPQKN